jgi:hypothetical protein
VGEIDRTRVVSEGKQGFFTLTVPTPYAILIGVFRFPTFSFDFTDEKRLEAHFHPIFFDASGEKNENRRDVSWFFQTIGGIA